MRPTFFMARSMETFLSRSELIRMAWNAENNILVVYSETNLDGMISTCDTCYNSNFYGEYNENIFTLIQAIFKAEYDVE